MINAFTSITRTITSASWHEGEQSWRMEWIQNILTPTKTGQEKYRLIFFKCSPVWFWWSYVQFNLRFLEPDVVLHLPLCSDAFLLTTDVNSGYLRFLCTCTDEFAPGDVLQPPNLHAEIISIFRTAGRWMFCRFPATLEPVQTCHDQSHWDHISFLQSDAWMWTLTEALGLHGFV